MSKRLCGAIFLEEWNYQIKLKLAEGQRQFLAERAATHAKLLHTNLQGVSDYVTSHHIQTADFLQVWALMGGRWNTLEFERLYRVALLQRKHSELVKVVERMGRTTQTDGVQYLTVASGVEEKLNSAAKSDIEGITIGQSFNALLPIELAQFFRCRHGERIPDKVCGWTFAGFRLSKAGCCVRRVVLRINKLYQKALL